MHNQARKGKVTEINSQQKAARSSKADSFGKAQKVDRRAIPPAQRERVKQKHISGKKKIEIAREEHIDRSTVAKIVREPDVAAYVKNLREKFYGRMEEVMTSAINYALSAEEGGKLAYTMMKDAGIVKPPEEMEIIAAPAPDSEEQAIQKIALAMLKGTVEKHKFFGLPLPEADEIEEEIKKAEQEKVDTDV